jgi:hypothetical protein
LEFLTQAFGWSKVCGFGLLFVKEGRMLIIHTTAAMKKLPWLAILLFGLNGTLNAQQDTILQRFILIGDAGELTNGKQPVVDAVKKLIPIDKKTTIFFLGDNLYSTGLPDNEDERFPAAKAVLDSQLSVADNTPAKVYMIPGNHDWKNGGRDGYAAVIREQLYVDFLGKPNVKFYPEDGCPGPIELNFGTDITVVLFDSQWWLHPYDKPEIESDCPFKTKEEFIAQLEDIVARNAKKLLIIACHHPFKTNSVHGGFFPVKSHLFPFTDWRKNLYIPLPVIGSIYPIVRSVFGTPQDVKHPIYENMVTLLTNAVKPHPNVIFWAGHDHGLQLIKDSSRSYIVSGGGAKTNRVSIGRKALYSKQVTGFAVMEITTTKNVYVSFYEVTDSVHKGYSEFLTEFSKFPEEKVDTTNKVSDAPNTLKDTITVPASKKFPLISGLKRYFLGQNYRAEWSTPVNMKVFHITREKGGFTIKGLGGGKQTKSLHLVDKNGKQYVLRAIEKNPTKAIPEQFRGTLAADIVTEFNSGSHPYAALTIPPMGKSLDVVTPHPELFFVPDDPALGFYRPLFSNTVCLLEERNPSIDGSDTKSTAKVFNKLIEENDHRADQFAVLRARLLDILTGDFDRHFDQWKWATNDTGKGQLYYPIPRDRDQVFFYSDGKLLKIISKNVLPYLRGFHHTISKVDWLGFSAKDFDRLFLTDLDGDEWRKTIREFQQSLSDTEIRSAVRKLPPEIYAINGETIVSKLISRRGSMEQVGMQYYKFISRNVNVVGSNEKEFFQVTPTEGGIQVRVYARENRNDTSFIMYNRVFKFADTYEIRLYGLNGDDLFYIDDKADSKIKIRIIGGRGNDTFDIHGNVRNIVYDMNLEGNFIKHTSRTKNRLSKDPPVNSYNILGFKYNKTHFPQIEFGFNSDDGFVAGLGFTRITHGFRNEPYATSQKFSALYSLNKATRINYLGEFNHIVRDFDLLLIGEWRLPGLNNFFGMGNTTVKNPALDYDFYRTRFRAMELQTLMRKRYFEKLHIMLGPYFYQYSAKYKDNENRILGKFAQYNLDSADIFSTKNYLGAKFAVRIDNRNNDIFPTRGVFWVSEVISTAGITSGSDNYSRATTDMTIFASLNDPARVVAVVGLGAGRILTKNFEYFQSLALGAGTNNLHGFRKNRYLGRSTAYGSFELRVKVMDINSYTLRGPLGLTGFYDIGRVWLKGQESRRWHGAYGGGFYMTPFNLFYISAMVGFSPKEKLINFTLGTKINLTF